jgi:asparagine synthase (glutamine-hydrolysing)
MPSTPGGIAGEPVPACRESKRGRGPGRKKAELAGIAVIMSRENPDACRERLACMLAAMQRGGDGSSGSCCVEEMGMYLGWACPGGSFSDCLPILSGDGSATLVFAGETCPDSGEISALRGKGYDVSGLDARYLIHLYEDKGIEFVEGLNGWFSGALVDRRKSRCFIFNDRYGMRRLFIHEGKESRYIASRASAILSVVPETREFDPAGLAEYITCGCTLGARSLYRDIQVMPAASLWTAADGCIEQKRAYFVPREWESQDRLDEGRYVDAVVGMFPAVVRRHSKARVPVGISLTGGLDTRMLMACLDTSPGEFPCYTFASIYRDTYDVKIARDVARRCGQTHTALVLGEEFLRDFPRYMEDAVFLSDGYLGLPGAAELYVNFLAREIAPVRLTGNYGSELLRGVRAFKSALPGPGLFKREFDPHLHEAVETFRTLASMDPVSFALFQQAPHFGYGRSGIEDSQVLVRTPFMDNDLVRLVYRRPAAYENGTELSVSIIERYRPDLAAIPTDRGDLGRGGPPARLIRRACRETLFKGEYWASNGWPDVMAVLSCLKPWRSMEEALLGRHKFQHFAVWLRERQAEYVREILLSRPAMPECFERRTTEEMVRSHLDGRGNYLNEVDMALTITLIAKLLLGPERSIGPREGREQAAAGREAATSARQNIRLA